MRKEKATNSGGGLAVIEQNSYAILAPDSGVAELISSNLSGESMSEFDLDQIKVPAAGGLAWTVPGLSGDETTPAIEGIIVHIAKRRQYWKSSEPTAEPPDCSSKDMLTGRGNPGGSCEGCPLNEWGSAVKPNGDKGKGKACKESRAIFLVRAGDRLPVVVHVPPSSLQSIKQYLMRLPVPYFQAVTKLSLGIEKSDTGIKYSEIRPSLVGTVPPEAVGQIRSYAADLQKSFG